MIAGGIAATVVPFLIAGIIIYIQLSGALLEISKEKSSHIAEDVSSLIQASLMQEIKLASAIAASPEIVEASITGDYRVAQLELEAIHKRIGKGFFTIFVADEYGIVKADALFKQQIGLDISDREYFSKAKEGNTGVVGPLLARGKATPGDTIIIVSVPIEKDDVFHGIVTIGFNSDFLINILSQRKSGSTGHAFLINTDGLVLVHPKKEFNLKLQLFDKPGTEELKTIIERTKIGTLSYLFEGKKIVAGISRVDLTGWIAVFAQGKDEIMNPARRILSSILISGILFLFITLIIIIVLSSEISNPLLKIMDTMKQVTKHSSEIIIQLGLDKRIIFVSQAFEKITGIKSDMVTGTEFKIKTLNNTPENVIWETLETGNPWSGRIELSGKGSNKIVLGVVIAPIIDNRNHVQGYLQIGRDITEELVFEKRLQQAQKLEAIGTLAGGIAHDFNNILGVIFGYAELSLIKLDTAPEAKDNIRQIISASERARDLVNQILTFSRKTEIELRPLVPKSIISEAIKLLRASIPATIDIQSKISSNSSIIAEPTQIHQVIINLFTNAAHAIGDNPGTITLELEDFFVDDEFARTHPNIEPGKHIVIRVSDTGTGMTPATMEHIFEPFFTTKPHEKGTGLGLSVVHGIINKFNGIITVYSEIDKGTVFNIIIPCVEIDGIKSDEIEHKVRKGVENILFLDDEVAITSAMHDILTILGYKVTAFTDSMEALAVIKLKPNDYDIVITDYSMPQMTGLELAGKLKEVGINIPVILTSGYIGENMENAARSAGISELIIKPISTYQLADAIERALQKE